MPAGQPGGQERERVQLGERGSGDRYFEMKVRGCIAGVTGVADQAEHLAGRHPETGMDAIGNRREMRAVVMQAVIAQDTHG